MSKEQLRLLIREMVSTDFKNDGYGGIESQTTNDTMGYWHGDSGPLHQGSQPGEKSPHIFFDNGGGEDQAKEQSQAASESGAKEQVEGGLEESENQEEKPKKIKIRLRRK